MKKLILIAILFLLMLNTVFAESIDGPANIREKPNGKIIFSLNDGAIVGCHGLSKNGWYVIALTVFVKESSFTKDKKVKAGEILYDIKGKEIGKTSAVILPQEWEDIEYHNQLNLYSCVIDGYTFENNIKPESLLERQLEDGLKNNNQKITVHNFAKIIPISKYGYKYTDVYDIYDECSPYKSGDFSHSCIYEFSAGPFSMGIRAMLVFYKEELVALIYTERDVILKFYKQKLLKHDWNYRIGYIKPVDEKVQKDLEEQYIYFFGHSN